MIRCKYTHSPANDFNFCIGVSFTVSNLLSFVLTVDSVSVLPSSLIASNRGAIRLSAFLLATILAAWEEGELAIAVVIWHRWYQHKESLLYVADLQATTSYAGERT
jgi:hypothetical protein